MGFAGKKQRSASDYVFYSPSDAAFDTASAEFRHDLWCETGDERHLPRRQNATPWKFVLRRLSAAEKAWIQDMAASGMQTAMYWCVALSLRSVVSPDGGEESVDRYPQRNWSVASDEWVDAIRDDQPLYQSLALYVLSQEINPDPKS